MSEIYNRKATTTATATVMALALTASVGMPLDNEFITAASYNDLISTMSAVNQYNSSNAMNYDRIKLFAMNLFGEMRDMTNDENDCYVSMIQRKSIKTGKNVFELI